MTQRWKVIEISQGETQHHPKKNNIVLSYQISLQIAELLDLIFISSYFSCPSSGRDAKEQRIINYVFKEQAERQGGGIKNLCNLKCK